MKGQLVDRRSTAQGDQCPIRIAPEDRVIGPAGAHLSIDRQKEGIVEPDVEVEPLHLQAERLRTASCGGPNGTQQPPIAGRPIRLLVASEDERLLDADAKELLPVEDFGRLPVPEELTPPSTSREVFVCADAVYREAAAAIGYRALPHPAMARGDADASGWLFAAFIGERELFERIDVIP
ncbi:MAG: hypothetical protein ABR593_09075, partial [Candidatus Limnocylindria bacterium]